MARGTEQHSWGSDVYHRPDPETDCPIMTIAPIATMASQPWDDCLTRIKILEQEVTDLKEFVHQLIDKLNVQELRRQHNERRQQGR